MPSTPQDQLPEDSSSFAVPSASKLGKVGAISGFVFSLLIGCGPASALFGWEGSIIALVFIGGLFAVTTGIGFLGGRIVGVIARRVKVLQTPVAKPILYFVGALPGILAAGLLWSIIT